MDSLVSKFEQKQEARQQLEQMMTQMQSQMHSQQNFVQNAQDFYQGPAYQQYLAQQPQQQQMSQQQTNQQQQMQRREQAEQMEQTGPLQFEQNYQLSQFQAEMAEASNQEYASAVEQQPDSHAQHQYA